MLKRAIFAVAVLCLGGCQKSDTKVLIGATAVVAPGAAPIEDAVVVVTGKTIRAAGMRKDVPIPQDSERTSLAGKWIVAAAGGRIAEGQPADLLILDHAPNGVAPASAADVGRRLVAGAWETAR